MLNSHWQNGWILMALPLELSLSGEPCSHQPSADQHISNRGTHTLSYTPPPHSSLLPVSFLKGTVLLFWQKSSCPLGIAERTNNRFGLRKVWKLLLQNQESEMETSLVEDWVKISSWMQRKISWILLMIFIMFLLLNECNKTCFSYVIPNINCCDIWNWK